MRGNAGLNPMTGWVVAAALLAMLPAGAAHASHRDVEGFVAGLNEPSARQSFGLERASRPERVVNRLELVFKPDSSADHRSRAVRAISSDFLRAH